MGADGSFERTYVMQSWARAASLPLIGLVLTGAMCAMFGAFQPAFEITCRRAGGFDASCVIREHTLFSRGVTAHFRLAETEVIRHPEGWLSFVTPLGPLPVGPNIRQESSQVRARLMAYREEPGTADLTLRGGFSTAPFLLMGPLAVLVLLVPAWGLGGGIVVHIDAGRLRVRRDRLLHRGREVEVTFPAHDPPKITAARLKSRRRRHQGVLWAEREGTSTLLAENAAYDTFSRIAADLDAELQRAR